MSRIAAPGGRGDHANAARNLRQRALAFRGKQTFGGQLGLELLELPLERAEAGFLEMLDDQLKIATRLVQADTGPRQDLLPVARPERDTGVARLPHRATHLRRAILEGEIPVSGGGYREIGQFGFDPDDGHARFEQQPHFTIEARDRVDIALGRWRGEAAARGRRAHGKTHFTSVARMQGARSGGRIEVYRRRQGPYNLAPPATPTAACVFSKKH